LPSGIEIADEAEEVARLHECQRRTTSTGTQDARTIRRGNGAGGAGRVGMNHHFSLEHPGGEVKQEG
jgi:hypothetical protein